ncbi:hypothetical protein SDC9_179043 [bioreactor metagenome]|uniref:2-aminoadipate transaminase n=2 Tax=root TaxID=1 RepID=A0A645H0R2_9ZZZZ
MVDVMLREGHYERHLVRLRQRLGKATEQALDWLEMHECEVFARNPQSLYLWATFPGNPDAVRLAERLLAHKVTMAPGHVFNLDPSQTSPWSRCNVGAMLDPRFEVAYRAMQELR